MSGLFLFDGDCGFCTTSANGLRKLVPTSARVAPWQQEDIASLGLTVEECSASVQWIDTDGRAHGPDAIAALMKTSRPWWRAVGQAMMWPPVRSVAWPSYDFVSRHRHRLPGGRPACQADSDPSVGGLRRRKRSDVRACIRLLAVIHGEDHYPVYYPASPRSWLAGNATLDAFVVERQREILGHVAVESVGHSTLEAMRWRELTGYGPDELAAVARLFVRRRVRRHGVGAALLDKAVEEIRGKGLLPVTAVVTASEEGVRLVEERGWRLLATYPWGERRDGLQLNYYAAPRVPLAT